MGLRYRTPAELARARALGERVVEIASFGVRVIWPCQVDRAIAACQGGQFGAPTIVAEVDGDFAGVTQCRSRSKSRPQCGFRFVVGGDQYVNRRVGALCRKRNAARGDRTPQRDREEERLDCTEGFGDEQNDAYREPNGILHRQRVDCAPHEVDAGDAEVYDERRAPPAARPPLRDEGHAQEQCDGDQGVEEHPPRHRDSKHGLSLVTRHCMRPGGDSRHG